MSTNVTLTAQMRNESGKGVARKLRTAGRVPAVLYGKDMEPVHLTLDSLQTKHLFYAISVENTIIDLSVEGEDDVFPSIVREVQVHPHRADLVHVDFYRVQKGVALDVSVPVHLTGTPVGVQMNDGILDQVIHEVQVRCIPSLIPESFEVDVSELDLNESLHVFDLVIPEEIELLTDEQQTLCAVALPKVVVEEPVEGEEEVEEEEGAEPAAEAAEAPESTGEAGSED